MHHPKADIDRLYMKGKGEGRGLLQTAVTYKAEIINIAEYLNTKYAEDQFLNIVKSHESNQPNMNPTIKMAAMVAEELGQSNDNSDIKKEGIQHIEVRIGESIKKKWESKVMYGQYVRSMDRQLISTDDTFLWWSKGDLMGKIEAA